MTTTHPLPTPARDGSLDDTLRDSFPASDPPPSIPDPEPTSDQAQQAPPSPGVPRRRWTDRLREQGIELDVH